MQIVNNTLFIIVSILFLSLFGTLVFIAVDGLITYYRSKKVLSNKYAPLPAIFRTNSDKYLEYLEYLSEYRKEYENETDINKLISAETVARDVIRHCASDPDVDIVRFRAKLEAAVTRRENLRSIKERSEKYTRG